MKIYYECPDCGHTWDGEAFDDDGHDNTEHYCEVNGKLACKNEE
jgi:hypothetical protein